MDYKQIIPIEQRKSSDKLCIRGMGITISDILEYLAGCVTEAEILFDFSALTSDTKSCYQKLLIESFTRP